MKLWLVLAAFIAHPSRAEYRVFRLKIEKAGAPGQPAEVRYLESNLDPDQYRFYGWLNAGETVTYVATWRCRERTGNFRDFCKNPREPASSAEDTVPSKGLLPPQSPDSAPR